MASKLLIVALISIAAIVLSLYNIMTTSESTNLLEMIENPFVSYSINTKCELYNLFMENSRKHDSFDSTAREFVGVTPEDVSSIISQVDEKFYGDAYDEAIRENPGGLAPNFDQGIYQQEITETALTLFTDKAMITNDINPKLKKDVRELLNLRTIYLSDPHNFESIRKAIDAC